MVATPGGRAGDDRLPRPDDDGRRVPIPDPRHIERLRGFVDAMDRLRAEPMRRTRRCWTSAISVAAPDPGPRTGRDPESPVPPLQVDEAWRCRAAGDLRSAALHHVALMRNAELVVKYHRGPEATTGRHGYAGVFRCSTVTDQRLPRRGAADT